MNFNEAVEVILGIERGFVAHIADPGGVTNFGISQRSYPDLNIAALTREQAVEIYRRDYWDKHQTDKFPELLRLTFFDCCVNQGSNFAVVTMQNVVGTPADGVIGPDTLSKIPLFNEIDLLERFTTVRLERYIQNKNYGEFGVGWIRRLFLVTFTTLR